MKITPKNNVSHKYHRGLWKVALNGDPTSKIRDCAIQTEEGISIIGVGPMVQGDHNMDMCDAQHIVLLHNKCEVINECWDGFVKYFQQVGQFLDRHPEHPNYKEQKARIDAFLKKFESIWGGRD